MVPSKNAPRASCSAVSLFGAPCIIGGAGAEGHQHSSGLWRVVYCNCGKVSSRISDPFHAREVTSEVFVSPCCSCVPLPSSSWSLVSGIPSDAPLLSLNLSPDVVSPQFNAVLDALSLSPSTSPPQGIVFIGLMYECPLGHLLATTERFVEKVLMKRTFDGTTLLFSDPPIFIKCLFCKREGCPSDTPPAQLARLFVTSSSALTLSPAVSFVHRTKPTLQFFVHIPPITLPPSRSFTMRLPRVFFAPDGAVVTPKEGREQWKARLLPSWVASK